MVRGKQRELKPVVESLPVAGLSTGIGVRWRWRGTGGEEEGSGQHKRQAKGTGCLKPFAFLAFLSGS